MYSMQDGAMGEAGELRNGTCNCGVVLGTREIGSWNCVVGLKSYSHMLIGV